MATKQLQINLNAVKRLKRDKLSYERELEEAQEKINNTTFEPGTSEYKRLVDLREEAEQMIQDCENRVKVYMDKLNQTLNDFMDKKDDPLVQEALAILQ